MLCNGILNQWPKPVSSQAAQPSNTLLAVSVAMVHYYLMTRDHKFAEYGCFHITLAINEVAKAYRHHGLLRANTIKFVDNCPVHIVAGIYCCLSMHCAVRILLRIALAINEVAEADHHHGSLQAFTNEDVPS